MEHPQTSRKHYDHRQSKSVQINTTTHAAERESQKRKEQSDKRCRRPSHFDEIDAWMAEQKTVDDVIGQSTPMNRSFENNGRHCSSEKPHAGTYLDVSRAEIAEEFTKQQSERLEKLWQHQNEENRKIAEKFDESVIHHKRNSTLREQHARQMETLRLYYEDELSGLKKELLDMQNTMYRHNKHEDTVKDEVNKQFQALSATNAELSAKCDGLEDNKRAVEDQLKEANEQNRELESQCQQLVATNQIIDTRSREIKRIEEETTAKYNSLEKEVRVLQCKCNELTNETELLRTKNIELQASYNRIVENNRKLTDKCYKQKEENRVLRDRNKTQESLIEKTNRSARDQQRMIECITRELEDGKTKWEVDRSVHNATQQRVDRLVVQNRDKDLIIQNLEKQIKNLDGTLKDVTANTAKAGLNEIKESIRKDRQHLSLVMREYDSLNTKHEETQTHVQHLEDKLAQSRNESEDLRKQLSQLNITKRNLENSLRQVLGNQKSCRRLVEQSRKTWKQSENFNFFTGEPRRDEGIQKRPRQEKITEYMESTRKESQPSDDNDLVDLSPISSGVTNDPGYPEESRIDAFNRRQSQISAENRFLELNDQRRRLEAALIRIPATRMSKQEKQDKKLLEDKLDEVLREIGQTRLKMRAQV